MRDFPERGQEEHQVSPLTWQF